MALKAGIHVGPWTDEDLVGLPEDAQRYELLEGTLLVHPLPSGAHQLIRLHLALALDTATTAGLLVVEAMGVRLPDHTVFIPDVVAI